MNNEKPNRLPKIKNKNPAEIQITAEQLLREALERQDEVPKIPKQVINDKDELLDYQLRKRRMFEDACRRNRFRFNTWIKYATWEESQRDLPRARSVYLRALEVDQTNITIRMKFIEMELKHRNINLARNLLDQSITIMPRVDQFWYKYIYLEELMDQPNNARQIFERWMQWKPNETAWQAYIKFEKRYNETSRARQIYQRFCSAYPEVKNFVKWTNFEEQQGNFNKARDIFTEAIEYLKEINKIDQKIIVEFAKFESRLNEIERARAIYKHGLSIIPKSKSLSLYQNYTRFEKQYGDFDELEHVVVSRRREIYIKMTAEDPLNYSTWIDYAKLEESQSNIQLAREVYERAIANVPEIMEKKYWRRYIYIWIYYIVFEELIAKDIDRAQKVYASCLDLIPHKKFTFAKIWILAAKFEIRQLNLQKARKLLGISLGKCPKNKIFKEYIKLELKLREFDRVRTIYTKFIKHDPQNCANWIRFAELEKMLDEHKRVRAIYELAISLPTLDMPEMLWKSYIDYEMELNKFKKTRELYKRLLKKTNHVKIWISFAKFELETDLEKEERIKNARALFKEAHNKIKLNNNKEDRVVLLEEWKGFEQKYGTKESIEIVENKMPRVVKKRRTINNAETDTNDTEEYFDYIFPDDDSSNKHFNLVNQAHEWKQKMEELKQKKKQKNE